MVDEPTTPDDGAEAAAKGQRKVAREVAGKIVTGVPVVGLHARFAATVIEGMAARRPKGRGRPGKDSEHKDALWRDACMSAAAALKADQMVAPDDAALAADALREFARQCYPKKEAHRPHTVLGDAAVLVEVAPRAGRSKRAEKRALAEMWGVDESSITRAVVAGRDDAMALIEMVEAFGGKVRPRRK